MKILPITNKQYFSGLSDSNIHAEDKINANISDYDEFIAFIKSHRREGTREAKKSTRSHNPIRIRHMKDLTLEKFMLIIRLVK